MAASNDDLLDRLDWIIDRLDIILKMMRAREEREGRPQTPLPNLQGGSQYLPDDWKPDRAT